ncbi:MAG: peptide ABC transporter substrate-binding protein [Clostridiales bacterium]|nr:peptide ABC transporter substrate-binding protein [Clostridiales bacterium]
MKKLLAMALVAILALGSIGTVFADAGSQPAWEAYDALIAEIKSTTDFVAREALMHEAEDMLMDTGALVPLYYYNDIFMAKPDFTGYFANAFGTKFFMYATNGDQTVAKLQLASEPDKLEPALNSTVDGATLAANSFGGLYSYDADSQYVPNFATGYEMSEDGLTYTFTMRDGLVWSDGSPLTAKDFEYSWKRAVSAETAADYEYMFNVIKGYPDALEATASEDGKTFTVVLSSPCAYFLDLAAFPTFFAVHQETVENAKGFRDDAGAILNPGAWATEAGFVSSGAFVLESWTHDESMVYVKNDNYWDAENVKLERIELMLSADDAVIYAAYQAGDLDFIDTVPQDQIQNLLDTEEFHIIGNLGTYYGIFNVKSKLFDGLTVEQAAALRKGLSAVIDRQYIVDTIAQTGQQVANSFIPAGMLDGHGGEFKQDDADFTYPVETGYFAIEPDLDNARELMTQAGYEFDANGMLSASTPLTMTYIYNTSSAHGAIAESMQQDFAQIGVVLNISTLEWNVFLNERKAGNFDFARNGWLADFNDPINMLEMWTTTSGNNDAQFGR